MIKLTNISKHYIDATNRALDDVSCTINKGEIMGIVGESGSGKSTFLRLINLLETPSFGQLTIDGINYHDSDEKTKRAFQKTVGTVFQNHSLLYNLTLFENVALPLKLMKKTDDRYVMELLSFVGLEDMAQRFPSQLSGGESQRVAIARALVTNPKILLCDEPTSSLDLKSTQEILQLLKAVQEKTQATVVFVTHELESVRSICNRAIVLEEGKIVDVLEIEQQNIGARHIRYVDIAREVLRHD